jgi:hypothetical protein
MIFALAALFAAAAPASGGCADHWAVELDGESFANNGAGKTFTAAELDAFQEKVQGALRSAVSRACREGNIRSAAAGEIRQVVVISASGATEPQAYAEGKRRLNFEWVFAEENLAIPARREIIDGLTCWADPRAGACLEPND